MTVIPASIARMRFASLLEKVARNKLRFLITKSGNPRAVFLGIQDFDDMLEELDPEFQKSLRLAAREYRQAKVIRFREYIKRRRAVRRAR